MMIQAGLNKSEVVATSLRMPRDIRDELKIQAIKAGRSYNTHAVLILSQALRGSNAVYPKKEEGRQGGNPDGLKQS